MNRHISTDELLDYLDGTLREPEKLEADVHLAQCHSCQVALRDFRQLGKSLQRVPLQRTSQGFTGSVMARVLSGGKEPFTFRILTGLAYAFAMLIVLVVLGGVFVLTGVIDVGTSVQQGNRIQSLFDATSSTLASVPTTTTELIREYLPFMFGAGSIGITSAIFLVVMMLFVFDRVMGGRIAGRIR